MFQRALYALMSVFRGRDLDKDAAIEQDWDSGEEEEGAGPSSPSER